MTPTRQETTPRRTVSGNSAGGPEQRLNINKLTRKLIDGSLNDMHAQDGHRQVTLLYKSPLSVTLFYFEEGGELPNHRVNGTSSVQVLDGQLVVETDHSQQVLSDGDFFVMESSVEYSIYAYEPSRALLTIQRERT